ncbi:MAG: trigger factor [Burkholderiales bacterium]|jgi:trigger factor|nr:trigger factor [Burkholderiales bacterium]
MQSTIETISQLERRVVLSVPLDVIEKEVQKRLAQLSKTAKIAGFRPGKGPMKMVTQQYGQQVRSEVITDQVQAKFNEAVREHDLRVAGYPRVEPKPANEAQENQLEFQATFEVYPEVTLGDLTKIELTRPQVEITDADIERTLGVLRKQRATFKKVERAAQNEDQVICDFIGRLDGEPFDGAQGRDFAITIGEGRMLPEFETALPGMKAGETKHFPLVFPTDYHGKEVAGKTAEFELTVKEVTEPQLPPLDETFARLLGIADGSVESLCKEVKSNLQLQLKNRIEGLMKEQVMAAMRQQAEMTLPKSLVEMEMMSMGQQMAGELQKQGMKPEDIKLSPEMFRKQAEERVKLLLTVSEVVRKHQLQPKIEQVRALVAEVAQTYEEPEAVVRWHFEKPERLANYEALATEHNLIAWIQTSAQVTDKPMTLEEVMVPVLSLVPPQTTTAAVTT